MYSQQCRYIMFFSTQGWFVISWVLINKMIVNIFSFNRSNIFTFWQLHVSSLQLY